MRVHLGTFATVAIVLAGCVASPAGEEGAPEVTQNTKLPDFKPVEAVEEAPRTLLEPPLWKQGEWWKIRLVDGFQGSTYETTRIVAGQEGDHYLVGMPSDQFSDDFMVMHIPGFGQISKDDLSFETHDVPTQVLRFPLVDGDGWETAFEGGVITTNVFVESETRARIQFTGSQTGNATYDALVGEVVRYEQEDYANYEVIDHGFDYSGVVTVPHQHDLIFQHFRIAGLLTGVPSAPATSITDTVTVDSTYDRVSAAIIAGGLSPDAPGGYLQEIATAPDGKVFEMTVMPIETGFVVHTFSHLNPGGSWTFEHRALGPGFIGAEGIAYHTYDVEMPSGRVLPSTGEHAHGG